MHLICAFIIVLVLVYCGDVSFDPRPDFVGTQSAHVAHISWVFCRHFVLFHTMATISNTLNLTHRILKYLNMT